MMTLASCGMTLVSCGASPGSTPPPPADLFFSCALLPDPSPLVHDLPGTEPEVLAIMRAETPAVDAFLAAAAQACVFAHRAGESAAVFQCVAGWHRSVAVAEWVAQELDMRGISCEVIHLGLDPGEGET